MLAGIINAMDEDDMTAEELRRRFAEGIPAEINPGPKPRLVTQEEWEELEVQWGKETRSWVERLGHANVSITLDVYSHVSEGLHGEAADRPSFRTRRERNRDSNPGRATPFRRTPHASTAALSRSPAAGRDCRPCW